MSSEATNILLHGGPAADFAPVIMHELSRVYGEDIRNGNASAAPFIKVVECSRERSIGYVRRDIGFFTKMMVKCPRGERKTLLLMDAEYLTSEAQSALRRSIEIHSHTTRFIMTTRDVTCILKPILSRFYQVFIPPSPTSASQQGEPNASTWLQDLQTKTRNTEYSAEDLVQDVEKVAEQGYDLTAIHDIINKDPAYPNSVALATAELMRGGNREDRLLVMLFLAESLEAYQAAGGLSELDA